LILCGCGSSYNGGSSGGGGGGGGTTSYAGQAQGFYVGTASSGYSFSSIILPNDKFYGLYGTATGNTLYVYGMMTGQGTSGNGTYTATATDYLYTGATFSDTISATDVPGTSVNGTITETGAPITFNGTSLVSSSFNYNTAASVSAISGTWSGTLLDGMTTTVTINSNGAVSGSSSGCSFTGTVTPDSSGKNFFDVSLTFGGSPCLAANQTATGIGIEYLRSDGVTHQLLAGVTASSTLGTVFFAER
jgi:hypothetical protein